MSPIEIALLSDKYTLLYSIETSLLLLLLLFGVGVQGRERMRTLYQSKDPNPTRPTHGRKKTKKTVGDKKERADHANRKALALLLKPASPTPSNTGSLRSLQRDTERGTKVLRY